MMMIMIVSMLHLVPMMMVARMVKIMVLVVTM